MDPESHASEPNKRPRRGSRTGRTDEPGFRIVSRSYTEDTSPMVEVLLLLHEWSLERRARATPLADSDP